MTTRLSGFAEFSETIRFLGENLGVRVSPPAPVIPGLKPSAGKAVAGSDAVALRWGNQCGSLLPAGQRRGRRRSIKSANAAGLTRHRLRLSRPPSGQREINCSSCDPRTRTKSPPQAVQDAPQQRLSRHRSHDENALHSLQPQTCLARPLVELDPRRALIQQIDPWHDASPCHEDDGSTRMCLLDDVAGAKRM